jgi:hypothetical protein
VVITPPPSSETVLDLLGAIPLKAEASAVSVNQAAVAAQLALEYLQSLYAQVSQQAVLAAMTTGSRQE